MTWKYLYYDYKSYKIQNLTNCNRNNMYEHSYLILKLRYMKNIIFSNRVIYFSYHAFKDFQIND